MGNRPKKIGAIYERIGGKLERVTVLDATNRGTGLWRIRLDQGQHAVAIYYGHCRSTVEGSQVGEFGMVGPSRGVVSDGGAVNRVAVAHADRVARTALASLLPLTVRHRECTGRPRPIMVATLVDAVCWLDDPMVHVARRHGWNITSRVKRRLHDGLAEGLEAIEAAWDEAGVRLPRCLGTIEVG